MTSHWAGDGGDGSRGRRPSHRARQVLRRAVRVGASRGELLGGPLGDDRVGRCYRDGGERRRGDRQHRLPLIAFRVAVIVEVPARDRGRQTAGGDGGHGGRG